MIRKRLLILLAAAALAAAGIAVTGCGDDTDGEGSEASSPSDAFTRTVAELKSAATSGEPYGAIRKAKDLPRPERATVDAFCEMVWQLDVNSEVSRVSNRPYIEARLLNAAEFEVGISYTSDPSPLRSAVAAAVQELRGAVDLQSLDVDLIRRYRKACYG
ncbi:MAG TPA: hypothetical protein VHF50_03640 [Solirubrobacterales bacterium]|nr:hypothetical protein [Solirubrobacterales bacterium]